MDIKTKIKFRQLLELERDEIVSKGKTLMEELAKNPGRVGDEADEALAIAEASVALRLCDRERHLLEKINNALDKLKDGSFGICEECGEEIPIKRLEIRPVASLCVLCKERAEKEEKNYVRE